MKTLPRILVIDDNAAIHDDFRKILCPVAVPGAVDALEAALFDTKVAPTIDTEFEMDSAYQGQEALGMVQQALAEGRPYAMAFVDGRMPPGWDGVETIVHLWKAYPDLQVVICTAYSDYSWEQIIARVGQSDSLVILKTPLRRHRGRPARARDDEEVDPKPASPAQGVGGRWPVRIIFALPSVRAWSQAAVQLSESQCRGIPSLA